ncbi:hypothetical protein [Fulvivirga lutea]|uniref:Prenyltransferase n=1 Tax=Fulvivirga lutea TaxID=2810512 RepID=A0A974WGY2_9BACT|nr:hypothetical protein [Fulvivirga lutea]QSE98354.1 hypothetical protein JR347_04560 [Fulvivirga lutea]
MSLFSYKTISLLSIDVAVGAVISSAFIAKVFAVEVDVITYLVLGLVVWAIYTFDHLLDAKISVSGVQLERYKFHNEKFIPISLLLIVSLLTILGLIFFLPKNVILYGTALGLLVIIYFVSIHLLPWRVVYHKEITAALAYFMGILIGPISSLNLPLQTEHFIFLLCYFLIVLMNLIIFSGFDRTTDEINNFSSIHRVMGYRSMKYAIAILSVLILLFSWLVFMNFGWIASTVLCSMFVVLLGIYSFSSRPWVCKYYRIAGDGIFLLPAVYFL